MTSRDITLAAAGAAGKTYIEDVFSTYLFTSTGTYQTITNGIDLAGNGGMVWCKDRTSAGNNVVSDTVRGNYSNLYTNTTDAAQGNFKIGDFSSTGFSVANSGGWLVNGDNYASWTFRKAPKFFDVVTYTGDGVTTRTISHSLGVVPGMIIVKRTDAVSNWLSYNLGNGNYFAGQLNTTNALTNVGTPASLNVTSTNFRPSDLAVNGSGATYVAYLFAHDTTTDGLIQCGSFTTDASGAFSVNLGWEPQYVMIKASSTTSDWLVQDGMRGLSVAGTSANKVLYPNLSNAEITGFYCQPTATGFDANATYTNLAANTTYIYMAIRRGPMKTPTDGTKVFKPVASSDTTGTVLSTGFPVDMQWTNYRTGTASNTATNTRLIGVDTVGNSTSNYLVTSSTAAEASGTGASYTRNWNNTGFTMPSFYGGGSSIFWNFRRAPGFFDVVCYTGTGVARTVNHNLGVAPELMIVKSRSNIKYWMVYNQTIGSTKTLFLNTADAATTGTDYWNSTSPTSTVFTVGTNTNMNGSGSTYVAYLFASCPGVSKVGSYTGTGATQTISCGFTGGARFVLIKRTDSTGDWYVWDTARGMVAGTDPSLLLDSTAAEVNANSIYTTTGGFQIVSTAAGINASGGSYIYLAIA